MQEVRRLMDGYHSVERTGNPTDLRNSKRRVKRTENIGCNQVKYHWPWSKSHGAGRIRFLFLSDGHGWIACIDSVTNDVDIGALVNREPREPVSLAFRSSLWWWSSVHILFNASLNCSKVEIVLEYHILIELCVRLVEWLLFWGNTLFLHKTGFLHRRRHNGWIRWGRGKWKIEGLNLYIRIQEITQSSHINAPKHRLHWMFPLPSNL